MKSARTEEYRNVKEVWQRYMQARPSTEDAGNPAKTWGKTFQPRETAWSKGRVKKGCGVAAFLVVGKQDSKGGVSGSITSELDRNQRMKRYSGMTRNVDFITKVMRKHGMIVTKERHNKNFVLERSHWQQWEK